MKRFKLFIPLIAFVLVAGFFYMMINRIGEGEYNPQTLPSALVNKPFPTFQLVQLENPQRAIQQTDLIGSIALINVWATWCPSCHVEHGYLNYLATDLGVTIYGVNYKDNAIAARQWLEQKGNPYRLNIFDPEGKLGLDMGVTGAPETYVIDHRGFVRMRFQGPLNEAVWQEKFVALMEQLRQEQANEQSAQLQSAQATAIEGASR